jgi:alkylation response protein AidB-like acyl-CoA dehydrogenase
MFVIDMKAPGVKVRPIHQASGGSSSTRSISPTCAFRIQAPWRSPGMGWNVALVTLMNERLAVGGSAGPDYAKS